MSLFARSSLKQSSTSSLACSISVRTSAYISLPIMPHTPIGPEVAFNAYIASCTLFLNLSYAAPVMILLVRGRQLVLANPPAFSLGKRLGYVTNYTAVIFVLVTSVVSSIPFMILITQLCGLKLASILT
jgi:hypothetical protein